MENTQKTKSHRLSWIKFPAIFLCLFFLNFNIAASMVTFYVIETGLSENARPIHRSSSWEDAFLEVFFDGGFIVSNAPILRLDEKPDGDILDYVNIHEAERAGIDFIIIAQLDYNIDLIPSEISFFIYKVTPNKKLMENKIQIKPSKTSREEYEYMKTIARGLVGYIE
ncbi:MAG: hypothetical protein FWB73_07380 [Treponema sp.]|nr:hypothetical protein [Treponema sp.]